MIAFAPIIRTQPQNLETPIYGPSIKDDPQSDYGTAGGSGRLVVIMDGPNPPRLNVEITSGEPPSMGYAKVASYMPIGPGGGVLTESTVREVANEEGTSTSRYGIIFGKPASRLMNECKQIGSTPVLTEKE